ncbi:lipopolysaccharide biosynthesis protein [Parasphingopyxis sp.]|uniref:lipopolysaccharide biosynthesis protein n=1 Tax=Parasphingopyxis sp. TaxID=1920299 RepID=UPI00262DFFA3|nr:lipopolysaccharide biosynthesis protein [Parasphingopyxis sp.]
MVDIAKQEIPASLRDRVRSAVFWRSGSQIVAQMITWATTFLVIRMLSPEDYGLVAMAALVVIFLSLMEGFGFASSLIQRESVSRKELRQVFGLLILINVTLAGIQFLIAPLAAAYFNQPELVEILRVQTLLYFITPFLALPFAILSRELEYRKLAIANLIGSIAGAGTALTMAVMDYGVWTLVFSPIVMFAVRATCMTFAARSLIWPSFSFRGARAIIGFGGALTLTQFFWFLQSQSDIFIAGRIYDAYNIGLYTTSLFLAQILVSKFVPPLNDVAFAAYSRMHREKRPIGSAFANSARLILTATLPFYFGLAITAAPLVEAILGQQWLEIIPIVSLLALAMPFMTLQILFGPATNALGRPGIAVRVNICGAAIMATGFLVAVNYGIIGLAWAWLIAMPILTAVTMFMSMPTIGVSLRQLAGAVAPGLSASLAMAIIVVAIDALLPPLSPLMRLLVLAGAGMAAYAALLLMFARSLVAEMWDLIVRRQTAPA